MLNRRNPSISNIFGSRRCDSGIKQGGKDKHCVISHIWVIERKQSE